jgi:spore coat protein H
MNMKYLFTFKYTIASLFFLSSPHFQSEAKTAPSVASDPIVITSNFYHVDEQHHLILINKPVAEVKAAVSDKNTLLLDKEYDFVGQHPVIGTANSCTVAHANTSYTVYFTNLPIVHIDTKYAIIDSPSVFATFTMSETNGNAITSNLGVEVRGGYSQSYPKKSYELSFWADTLGNRSKDVKLLGMRNDNKWNLQALYNEPLRVNSKVANELWEEMSKPYYKDKEPDAKIGIAMAYVEVFINDEYKGLYALTERIDRKQLKLKKYTNTIKGELYKGSDWGGAVTFERLPVVDNSNLNWGGFEYKHPEEHTDWASLYDFVSFVEKSTDAEFVKQYQSKFALQSAVDYYIFMNVLRASDNMGKNLYIAKYNVGEPYFYVPWDLDGVFGNNWVGQNENVTDDIMTNGFYKRLNQDCSATGFRNTLMRRWAELRTTVLTHDHIMAKFLDNNTYLQANSTYQREQAVWTSFSYDGNRQLAYVDTWLTKRLAYLDEVFNQRCALLSTTSSKQTPTVQLYPNPANDYMVVEASVPMYEVCIQDVSGRVKLKTTSRTSSSRLDISQLPQGLYVVLVKGENFIFTDKLLRN